METTRNPGWYAVLIGVGLGVLFALLGITGIFDARVGLGLAATSFLIAALLYIFYMRGNAVSKTGYATLISILAIGLILPFLTINQQQAQAQETATQYDLTLHRGAALFGQYCAPCHGYQGQGIIGPQINGSGAGFPAPNKLTDEEITRIISGGVANPADLQTYQMPPWLQTYGGPLTEEDISYLLALIRSSQPEYLASHPNLSKTNGFNYVLASLSNQTQIADFHNQQEAANQPKKPADTTFQDLTGKKTVTITAQDSSDGKFFWSANGSAAANQTAANITISVGTTVSWANNSAVPHNVYSGQGKNIPWGPTQQKLTSTIFAKGVAGPSQTFDKPGEYPFYCGVHPYMIGWITVK